MVALIERSKWDKARIEYEAGNYKTLKELSEKCEVDYNCLRQRIYQEGWRKELLTRNNKVLQVMGEVKEDLAKDYLSSAFKRAKRYEKLIDLSQEQLAAVSGVEGLPVLDPDALLSYSKVESTIHAIAKSALRISDKLDVTSNNQSIGESFVSAIAAMRENKDLPKLGEQDLQNVMEAEIID